MRTIRIAALCLAVIASPADAVEFIQTGRFTPDPFPDNPNRSPNLLNAQLAAGAGLVIVGESEVGELYVTDAQAGQRSGNITPGSADTADNFGFSVDMDGSTAVVGAAGNGAYLYNVATGSRLHELTPTTPLPANASFGYRVAIGDGIALVSSSWRTDSGTDPREAIYQGRVYAFDVATGAEIMTFEDGLDDSVFGGTLDVSEGTAIIGARGDDQAGEDAGAAYLFDVASGDQITKLLGPPPTMYAFFAAGVAIDGDLAFVSEPGPPENPFLTQIGVFDATNGDRVGSLLKDTELIDDAYGSYLSANSGRLLVGSPLVDRGSAYLFDTETQTQIARITPTDGVRYGGFGWDVALSDDHVGVLADGSWYTFVIVPEPGAVLLVSIAMAGVLSQRRRRS